MSLLDGCIITECPKIVSIADERRISNKQRECDFCPRLIEIDMYYMHHVFKEGEKFQVINTHLDCYAPISRNEYRK